MPKAASAWAGREDNESIQADMSEGLCSSYVHGWGHGPLVEQQAPVSLITRAYQSLAEAPLSFADTPPR